MRIVVTGMGAVSGVGLGVEALRRALTEGRSGLTPLDASPPYRTAGRVGQVTLSHDPAVPRGQALLLAALDEALTQAGLTQDLQQAHLYLGTVHGYHDHWLSRDGADAAAPSPWDLGPLLAGRGLDPARVSVLSTACTASSAAVGLALDALRQGRLRQAIVAGFEVMTPFLYEGFVALRALGRRCRPFDAERDGLALGEGAAALVLEREDDARRRGAEPLAEIAGYGFGLDLAHLTAPDPSGAGAAQALRQALDDAALDELPGHINAHGTATRHNDAMECAALRRVFGQALDGIPVTSTKPITGHLCGAAGATEVIAAALALQDALVPATLGLERPDPRFAGLDFVRGAAREWRGDTAVSMNSGFGGTNAAVVLRRVEP
ncbi:beta-ketoacyl-[acyl-carrier-protein] synthase family protein [Ideonella sp. 4Y11]|uniref:Beta-ketoacyl-[acyl-carrier-protein] synthase family protein n=1 Tax=Ideonella aquatica TaxID=2824119 RepID=A0A941BIL7_9BURK|nr:beta-ketoacyl-[acyl-carrier-protein] synthase family protein [Ideonella aquatica]MBQ0957958.1 beta-ketoacyl-[acyl-carrier-protein] synthase family protein [Ideonella aquatica]